MNRRGSELGPAPNDGEAFRLLVESVTDYAIFMLAPDGTVMTWNAGAERIEGYGASEIIGCPYAAFFLPEDVQAGLPARALETASRAGRCEEEGIRVRKDGTGFRAHVVLTPVRDECGELRGFAGVIREVMERREAERAERRLDAEIAARKAAEAGQARLRESEERYRQQREQLAIILEGVADGITAQRSTGELLYANDVAARSCGFPSAEALLRAAPGEMMRRFETYDERGEPFDWSQLPGRRALAGEDNPSAELRIRDKAGGTEWWAMVRARAVRDEHGDPYLAVNIWRDVSEQRRREFEARFLAEATAVLSGGLEVAAALEQLAKLCVPQLADWCVVHLAESDALVPVSISHVDPGKVEWARELMRRYPIDPQRPLGAPRVVRTGRLELLEEITDALLTRAIRDPERLQVARQLGVKSAVVVPLYARGRTLGALALAFAESNRRYRRPDLALAEELGRRAGLAVDNARLYEEAQTAIEARDEFLSIAGHELKTPLAALLAQVGGLLRLHQRGDPPTHERTFERLRKTELQAKRLDKLIEELLDVSRITSGRLRLELEDVDLDMLGQEVVARFADEAARAGCKLELRASEHVRGRWDRLRIDQVLTNLVANGLKYGAGKPVEVEIGALKGAAYVSIRDRGIGIAPEHQARIFGRFERAVSERYYGGFGLGLWIARQIVEAHGGSIRLDSREGAGSIFAVEMPLHRG